MASTFHIEHHFGSAPIQPVLYIQIGDRAICHAVTEKPTGRLCAVSYRLYDSVSETVLEDLFRTDPLLGSSFYQVWISYAAGNHSMVPSAGIGKDDALQSYVAVYGRTEGMHLVAERIPGWQLFQVYPVPSRLHAWLTRRFPQARWMYQSGTLLAGAPAATDTGCFRVDLGPEHIAVVLVRSGNLLVSARYPYSSPDDVLFALLRACRQYGIVREHVVLELSGLIEADSALYRELMQYFVHPVFRIPSSWDLRAGNFPPHYFTSLNDLASCAS
ncbi:MAG: hypothetical protein RJA57_544 [Bacteroidota bacterium]